MGRANGRECFGCKNEVVVVPEEGWKRAGSGKRLHMEN